MGAAPVTFVALPVDEVCRATAGFLGVSIGVLAVGTAGCGVGVAVATGAVAGAAGAGLTGNMTFMDVTFMDVITCMVVLASTNDLNQIGTMFGMMDDCGWEPEGLGIIEYRDSLSCI